MIRLARLGLVAFVCCAIGLTPLAGGYAAVRNIATGYVLSERDVGSGYATNRPFTRARTLAEVSTGATPAIREELARRWIAGMQSGFNGGRSVSYRAIISTADLFRTSSLQAILLAWQERYLRLSAGARLPVPASAPGTSRFLLRGQMRSLEVLIYVWKHNRAVLSVWLIGTPRTLSRPLLIRLARRQDAKLPTLR